jgi:4-diphosphocytidyl-2-C-methyl-D-erythritol kinase
LNRLHGFLLGADALHGLACSLGADVPFFLAKGPCVGVGIGDILRPVALSCDLFMVLVNPRFPVPVSWAYSHWDGSACNPPAPLGAVVEALRQGDARAVAAGARNDLERAVFRKFPMLGLIAESLRHAGAWAVCMSGSGPTLFALCAAADRARIAGTVRDEYGDALWVHEACVSAGARRPAAE